MIIPRLVQNFSGNRAILLGLCGHSQDPVETMLVKLGISVEDLPLTDEALKALLPSLDPDRDVLFVDGDSGIAAIMPIAAADRYSLVPVIALVGVEAPSRLKALINLGVTAFIKKPVQASGVYSALFLGINQHRISRSLKEAVQEYEKRKRGRKWLVKAIISLMRLGIDEDSAYAHLRREAMRAQKSVEAYSEQLLQANMELKSEGADSVAASSLTEEERERIVK
jgi:AmiR/NasT family two-component response regulator